MKKIIILALIFIFLPVVSANVWDNILIADDATGENGATGIFAVDLDKDGDTDFVGGINTNDQVRWYQNQGNDTYLNFTVADNNGVTFVQAADMDNDGDIDIVAGADAGADGNGLILYTNDGNEVFSTNVIDTTRSRPIDLADFDNDGDIDIVSGTIIEDTVLLWLNNGFGSFTRVVVASSFDQVGDVRVVDIDGDGDNDILAVASGATSETAWFQNDGSNTGFTERNIDTTASTNSADAADLDGDGDIDITIYASTLIKWYENNGAQQFTERLLTTTLPVSGGKVRIGDLDNDDDNDIVYVAESLAWFDNNGDGVFSNKTIYNPSSTMVGLHLSTINGDASLDIAIGDSVGDEFRWFKNLFATLKCDFPSIFCDEFNYVQPMSTRGWAVEVGINIDNTYTPIGNKLDVTRDKTSIIPSHETDAFETSYRPDSGSVFTDHFLSPVFASQFKLTFANSTTNIFEYQADQKALQTAYVIRAEIETIGNTSGNMGWYYLNQTDPNFVYAPICRNCTHSGQELDVKIISFFSQRDVFPFNSSVPSDQIELFVGGNLLGTVDQYLFSSINYISRYYITKFNVGNFTIDDYFVMVGTDKDSVTHEQFYQDKFDNKSVVASDFGKGTGDMSQALSTIWDDMGLISNKSKTMAGIFLMFFLALILFAMSIKFGFMLSPLILIVLEVFFLILLIYIELMPKWIGFVLVMIMAGIGALIVFTVSNSE